MVLKKSIIWIVLLLVVPLTVTAAQIETKILSPEILLIAVLLIGLIILGIFAYWNKYRQDKSPIKKLSRVKKKSPEVNLEVVSESIEILKNARIEINVTNSNTNKPINKAIVRLGNRNNETNESGNTKFEDVSKGIYEISVEREFYDKIIKKIDVQESKESIQINLIPVSGLRGTQADRLNNTIELVRDKYHEIPPSDSYLPLYYQSIGENIIYFVEKILDMPSLFKDVDYSKSMDELISATEIICIELGEIMIDWKNVKIYEGNEENNVKCIAPAFSEIKKFEDALIDPAKFVEINNQVIKQRLNSVDEKITERIRDITIMPISGVWRISEKLINVINLGIDDADTNLKNTILLLFSDAILDYVEDMLNNDQILDRLKASII
jgi:hypothetical protein|tara:strand:- start:4015 stop:5163 length:1149 start_codon:yes stop_codon:yes gene_type:complete